MLNHKHHSLLSWIFIAILCISSAIYIRLYPLRAHFWDPSYEQASMIVISKIKESILQQIHQKDPSMPRSLVDKIATEQLNNVLHNDKKQVLNTIDRAAEQIFKASGKNHNIFLLEADPFYYYALSNHILETGKLANTINGSKYLNELMGAPWGYWQPVNYLPYIGVYFYKFLQFFHPTISLMEALAFLPLVFSSLIIAIFLLICRLLNISLLASASAAMLLAASPIFIKRSSLGWFDTDPINILFGFIILLFIIKTLSLPSRLPQWAWGIVLGITFSIYALFWHGWGFMLVVASACFISSWGFEYFTKKHNTPIKNHALFFLVLLISTILGIGIFFGPNAFFNLIQEAILELSKFTQKNINVWPNLFLEVGELKRSSPLELMKDTASILLFIFTILGLLKISKHIHQQNHAQYITIITFLALATLITLGALRFAIFWLIPLSVLCAIGIDFLINKITPKYYLRIIFSLIICLYAFNESNTHVRTILTPIYNDAWHASLEAIKSKTPTESTIISWWPPGHFIKATAKRKVLFDGASLDEGPIGFWIAKALLSNDEHIAQHLLQMITSSRNNSAEFLIQQGLSTPESIDFILTLSVLADDKAFDLASRRIGIENARKLMLLLRQKPAAGYLLIYNEMIEKIIGLDFMAKWNFDNPSLNINATPSRMSEALALISKKENTLLFNNNVLIDTSKPSVMINSETFGKGIPSCLIYSNNGQYTKHDFFNANLSYCAVLYTNQEQTTTYLMDRHLAESLLIRLFFFNAAGLKFFEPFHAETNLTGRTQIKTFQIKWNQ